MICHQVTEDSFDNFSEPGRTGNVFHSPHHHPFRRVACVFDSSAWTLRDLEEPENRRRCWANISGPNLASGVASEVLGFEWEDYRMVTETPLSDDASALFTQSIVEMSPVETDHDLEGGVIEVHHPRALIFRKHVKVRISELRPWRPKINIEEDFAEE